MVRELVLRDWFDAVADLGKPLVLAYSGGKDSTLVLHLLVDYMLKTGNAVETYVVYNEVWLDLPLFRRWVYRVLDGVRRTAEEYGLPLKLVVITPPEGKDFFTLVLERGWALPVVRRVAPWCVKEMKTRPTARYFVRKLGLKDIIYVTGARFYESAKRRKSMQDMGIKGRLQKIRMELFGEVWYFAPICDWSDNEVLGFLEAHSPPWGGGYRELLELYRWYGVGGSLRNGCWICPQVSRDWMLERFVCRHPEYRVVLEARERIIAVSTDPKYRERVTKNGNPAGRITFEGRREIAHILRWLLGTRAGRELMADYVRNTRLLEIICGLLNERSSSF